LAYNVNQFSFQDSIPLTQQLEKNDFSDIKTPTFSPKNQPHNIFSTRPFSSDIEDDMKSDCLSKDLSEIRTPRVTSLPPTSTGVVAKHQQMNTASGTREGNSECIDNLSPQSTVNISPMGQSESTIQSHDVTSLPSLKFTVSVESDPFTSHSNEGKDIFENQQDGVDKHSTTNSFANSDGLESIEQREMDRIHQKVMQAQSSTPLSVTSSMTAQDNFVKTSPLQRDSIYDMGDILVSSQSSSSPHVFQESSPYSMGDSMISRKERVGNSGFRHDMELTGSAHRSGVLDSSSSSDDDDDVSKNDVDDSKYFVDKSSTDDPSPRNSDSLYEVMPCPSK
jgi:hypothetical protein